MTPAIRIRQAELEIARLRFAYIDWLANEAAAKSRVLPPIQGHELIRDHGIAAQEVVIAEARLQEAQDAYGDQIERRLQSHREHSGYAAPLPETPEDAGCPVPSAEAEET